MHGPKIIEWAPARQPHQDSGEEADVEIWVSVVKIDASWVSDLGYYIAAGGIGGIDSRYEKFGIWQMRTRLPVEPITICIDEDIGCIAFLDGRHRFAWLRDHGATAVLAQVPRCCAADVALQFGTEEQTTLITI